MLLFWLFAITVFRTNLGSRVRLFSDEYDRSIYFERGLWFVNHQVPYRDTLSEYPQIPTYLFGFTHIVSVGENNIDTAYWKFSSFFSLLMGIVLVATIELLYQMLPNTGYRAYLLLLPAPLFFSLNRFDILPAYISLLSYKMIRDQKWNIAALLLGIGAFVKWYPALLLPAYLVYCYRSTGRIHWRMIAVFLLTCFIIILPTLLSGGIEALTVPYRFHMERGLETVSLPTLLGNITNMLLAKPVDQKYFTLAFLLLQISVVPFVFFTKLDELNKLLYWCILIICVFILFSRIYSPQWLLWLFPFCILAAKNRRDLALIVLYGIITYLGFPVVWDYFGSESGEMVAMGIVNIMLLFLIALSTIYRIRNPESDLVHAVGAK